MDGGWMDGCRDGRTAMMNSVLLSLNFLWSFFCFLRNRTLRIFFSKSCMRFM